MHIIVLLFAVMSYSILFNKCIRVLFCLFVLPIGLSAKSYFIDTLGNDAQAGNSPALAWKTLEKVNGFWFAAGDSVKFKCGQSWRGNIKGKGGSAGQYIVFTSYGLGAKPLILGSVNKNKSSDWVNDSINVWRTTVTFDSDIGNIILSANGRTSMGHKKWAKVDLKAQGDFWYDRSNTKTLMVYAAQNPAELYSDMECAINTYMVTFAGQQYMVVENLEFKYGGSYCIKGSTASHLIFQNLKITYMGGGDVDHAQKYSPSRNIRWGNAIEFNGNSHDMIVRNNEIGEMYDCAVGCEMFVDHASMYNIYFYNNIIYNSGLASLDFWGYDNSNTSTYNNIHFENNTCYDAGAGWGYEERPDKHGAHVDLSFTNIANTEIYFRNNIFYSSSAAGKNYPTYLIYKYNTDVAALTLNYNAVFTEKETQLLAVLYTNDSIVDPYIVFTSGKSDVLNFKSLSGKDANSIYGDPVFVDAAQRDFHLSENSSSIDAGTSVDVLFDFDNNARPSDNAFDLGAYERQLPLSAALLEEGEAVNFIYPNPTSGLFSIVGISDAAERIEVFNVLGEKVSEFLVQKNLNYSLIGQSSGVYFVKAIASSGKFTLHRLLLQ